MAASCPSCATESPNGARFCMQCGSPLAVTCSSCSTELPPDARFCSSCGTPVGDAPAPTTAAPKAATASSEERKVITVLFADLAGFTAHTEQSDPEDVRERLSTYHRRVRQDVERFGGRVEKLMGDGVFAVFGVPAAHEDDRERAVRAALRIQESVDELNDQQPDLELSVRIGITTGEAIVQLDPTVEDRESIIGDVVNTASRVEGVAAPGTVVVDDRTQRGAVDSIEFEELAPVAVKGKREPLRIWRAVAARGRYGMVVEDEHTTPFLGRDTELGLLVSSFDRTVREQSVQLVTVIGEPGVGKSRLLHEFRSAMDERPDLVWWRQGRCLPYGEGITFWALDEIIKAHAGIFDSDEPSTAADKLRRTVVSQIDDPADAAWVLAQLERLTGVHSDDSQGTSQELFAALTRFFESLASRRPLILVIEDLQWADPTLLEYIDHLTEWAMESPVFVVGTARPELLTTHEGWGGGKRNASTIGLSPLTDEDTARILASLLDQTLLDAGVQRVLLERCGGNPLYATEFVRYAADRGLLDQLAEQADIAIPDTIRGLIAARVDLLGADEKQVLRAASVVGRVFWTQSISDATGAGADELRERLRALATRELIRPVRQSSMAGQEEWTFTHALINDVAYAQIPRAERSRLHLSVASWIEQSAGERVVEVAELLAHHYTQILELAPDVIESVRPSAYSALMAAGERVAGVDGQRAAGFYGRALDIADTPGDRARARLRRCDLFSDYDAIDEQEQDLLAALEDARAAGIPELEADVLDQLSGTRWYRGDSEGRLAYAEQAFALVADDMRSEMATKILTQRVFDAWVGGDQELALDLVETNRARILAAAPIYVRARFTEIEGGVRLALGDEAGLETMYDAFEIFQDLNDTQRLNSSYNNVATNALFFRPATETAALMDDAIAMCEERGYRPHAEFSRMTRVESLFPLGRWSEAIEDLRAILAADQARGGSRVGTDAQAWLATFGHYREDPELRALLTPSVLEEALQAKDVLYTGFVLAAATAIAAHEGKDGDAARYADLFEETAEDRQLVSLYLGDMAEPLLHIGRVDHLEDLIQRARPHGRYPQGRLLQARALLAEARSQPEGALEHATEAIRLHEELDHVFDPTRARIIAARSMIALGQAEQAAPILERALRDARWMEATLLVDQVQALHRREAAAAGE